MKKCYWSRLRVLTWAVLFTAGGFASCSDDDDDTPPPPPVELKNQINYNGGALIDIRSVIFDVEDTDLYTFYLSPTAGITDVAGMTAEKDYLSVVVRNPKGTVNTATDTFEISYKEVSVKKQTLSDAEKVQLSADLVKETSVLNLYVEVALKSGKTLLARYNGTCAEAVPQKLANQYELDKAISAIGSVVEWRNPADGVTVYHFYTQSDVTAPSDAMPAGMRITVADGTETANIDLATADLEKVKVVCGQFEIGEGTTGTLNLSKNADGTELTVSLDALSGGSRLRAAYAGAFASGCESSDHLKVTEGEVVAEADMKQVFRYKESLMNNFAFGLVAAEAPAELTTGKYAVQLGLSDLNIGRTIDLATESSRCTFQLYDYVTYTTYDIGKSSGAGVTGTITTAGTAERLYLHLSVAFPDGPAVEGEWFGDITTVQEAFDLVPVKPFTPHMTILSEAGDVLQEANLSVMEMRLEKNYKVRGGDPQYGGATFDAYIFYFRPEGSDAEIESRFAIPMLVIPTAFLNSTDLDLAAGADGLNWSFSFNNRNIQQGEYSERYTMYGSTYGYCPDEAKTTVVRNADKTWKVSYKMKDSYPSSWNPDKKEGYQNTLTIEWEGLATKYSGTKKNDYPDDDY